MNFSGESQTQSNIISCLNSLEFIRNKLSIQSSNRQELDNQLSKLTQDMKLFLMTLRTHEQTIDYQKEQMFRMNQVHQDMNRRHKQILQNIEMLIYQQDYTDLKEKVNMYKLMPLEQSLVDTMRTDSNIDLSDSNNLNRAFVEDSQEKSQTQLSNSSRISAFDNIFINEKTNSSQIKIRQALAIINNDKQSFQRKQQVWLDVYYRQRDSPDIKLEHVTPEQVMMTKKKFENLEDCSEITLTEQYQPIIERDQNKKLDFSGKKIKSMILLKQKSAKKGNNPKTSIKKINQNHKQQENMQVQEDKLKKKLFSVNKTNDKTAERLDRQLSKKKGRKIGDIKAVKSHRKTLMSQF